MSKFGWSCPAGAEFDPRAPWNQFDEDRVKCCECSEMTEQDEIASMHADGECICFDCQYRHEERESQGGKGE